MTPIEPLQVSEVVEVEEALRRAEIGDYLYNCAYQYGDGQSDPREFGIEWHWQQSKPNEFGQGVLLAEAVAWHECMSEDGAETEAYKLRAFIRTLQSENEALRAAGEEARRALEPLLQDLHVQHAEDATAETKAERDRTFGLEHQRCVVEL